MRRTIIETKTFDAAYFIRNAYLLDVIGSLPSSNEKEHGKNHGGSMHTNSFLQLEKKFPYLDPRGLQKQNLTSVDNFGLDIASIPKELLIRAEST